MIVETRNIKPFIHFGFNRLEFRQSELGKKVKVYIDGNFNKNIFTFDFITSGTVTQITPRIYEVEFAAVGIQSIQLETTNTQTGQTTLSNEITTEQMIYSFDNDSISFDNTILTFDNL